MGILMLSLRSRFICDAMRCTHPAPDNKTSAVTDQLEPLLEYHQKARHSAQQQTFQPENQPPHRSKPQYILENSNNWGIYVHDNGS